MKIRELGDKKMNMEYSEFDEESGNRCQFFLRGYKCHKTDFCEKIHKLPREDFVLCKDISKGFCKRTASDCWYWHPEETVESLDDKNAPFLVQPMGDLIKYLRKEQKLNPRKYDKRETRNAAGPQVLTKHSRLPVGNPHNKELGDKKTPI